VKYFDWDEAKNDKLKLEREICFEDIVIAISEGRLHDIVVHPNPTKYPGQRIYIVEIQEYIYAVPFVEDEVKIFLKTIFASRILTKRYLKGEQQ
jgi:hypothetical protein